MGDPVGDGGRVASVRALGHQPALDGVRALAVVAVIVYHFHESSAPGGWAGVQLFFVLSGFLITSLLIGERAEAGRISVGHFYMRRALRLLPALVVMLAVYTSVMLVEAGEATGRETVTSSLKALTYAYNWFIIADDHWGNQTYLWSLSVEEQFYLLWPLIVVAVFVASSARAGERGSRPIGRAGRRWLVGTTVVGLVASAGLQAWFLARGHEIRGVAGTDATAYPILTGCLLAQARSFDLINSSVVARLRSAAGVVGLGGFLGVVLLIDSTSFAVRLVVALSSALLIFGLTDTTATLATRVFTTRPLRAIGRVSYGLYLWHFPAFVLAAYFLRHLGLSSSARIPLATVGMLAATVLSYRFVEQPFHRWKARFAVRRATLVPVSA